MDYLKILNQHNNITEPIVKKESIEIQKQIFKVSIVIVVDSNVFPTIEINSIIENIESSELINVFVLHSKNIDFSNKFDSINHNSVISKRILNLNNFNINVIDEILNDGSDYLIYTKSDFVIENKSYVENSILLMNDNEFIAKVDSLTSTSKNGIVSSKKIAFKNTLLYQKYDMNNISIPDPTKKGRTINISNFKGFDFNPGIIKKSAILNVYKDHLKFYDFNNLMTSNKFEAIVISQEGFKDKECINNIKVSFVMQVFLGDYPGSRSNPVDKFHRAVQTVLQNQNAELIVVSDGCHIVDAEIQEYLKDSRIKYAFLSRAKLRMYENIGSAIFYRGLPRQIGIELATGDVIAYIDSDDIVTPLASTILAKEFYKTELKHVFNSAWFDHENVKPFHENMKDHLVDENTSLNIGDNKFIKAMIMDGFINYAPWLHAHIKDIDTKWEDVIGKESEDIVFGRGLAIEAIGLAKTIANPYYIRCHFKGYVDV